MSVTSDGVRHSQPGLPRLTSLRAFAALVVFGYHALQWTPTRPAKIFEPGFVGVSLFFVLSGFVLTWSAEPRVSARRFYWRRVARVYPAYLVGLLLAASLLGFRRGDLLACLTLTQAWVPDTAAVFGINGPSWSLSCEALFYAIFPFVLPRLRKASLRRALQVCGIWWLATNTATVVLVLTRGGTHYLVYAHPVLRSGEFLLGIGAALAVQNGFRPSLKVAGSVAVAAVVASYHVVFPFADILVAIPAAILIAALATADLAGKRGVMTSRWAVFGGQVSYCFYLVHQPVLIWFSERMGPTRATVASFAAAAVTATAVHIVVERPVHAWLVKSRAHPVTARS